jgi:hypothetical protein
MAGLVPAIPLRQAWPMAEYFVYFLASRPGGAVYVGSILKAMATYAMRFNARRISSTGRVFIRRV